MVDTEGIQGLDRLLRNFRKVNFRIPNIESRFLDVIGEEALEMLRANTPVDTGNLSAVCSQLSRTFLFYTLSVLV